MKKKCCCMALFFIMCLLAGCSFHKEDTGNAMFSVDGIDTAKVVLPNLTEGSYDDENIIDAESSSVCMTDDGIYYWASPLVYGYPCLMYYDLKSETAVPVCNKADCSHNDLSCNALFETSYDWFHIYYYYDNLYIINFDRDAGEVNLYKETRDGGAIENYMTLYNLATALDGDGTSDEYLYTYPCVCIVNDYVYFINYDESGGIIHRMKLGDDTSEVFFENVGSRSYVQSLYANGDYIFFTSGNFTDDTYESVEGGIYCYNTVSDELDFIMEAPYGISMVCNECLYFYSENGIEEYSLTDGTHQTIIEGADGTDSYFWVDDEAIFLYENVGMLTAYDLKGIQMAQAQLLDISYCEFVSTSYLYVTISDGASQQFMLFDLQAFLGGEEKWNSLYEVQYTS